MEVLAGIEVKEEEEEKCEKENVHEPQWGVRIKEDGHAI